MLPLKDKFFLKILPISPSIHESNYDQNDFKHIQTLGLISNFTVKVCGYNCSSQNATYRVSMKASKEALLE